MDNIQRKLSELDEIYNICDKIINLEKLEQDDKELIDFIKSRYTVTQDDIGKISDLLKDKKKNQKSYEKEIKVLKDKLHAYCLIVDVNPNKDGNFVGFTSLRARVSNKKALLKRKLQEKED